MKCWSYFSAVRLIKWTAELNFSKIRHFFTHLAILSSDTLLNFSSSHNFPTVPRCNCRAVQVSTTVACFCPLEAHMYS